MLTKDALSILGLNMEQGRLDGDNTPWTMTANHRRELIEAVSKLTKLVDELTVLQTRGSAHCETCMDQSCDRNEHYER